MLALERTGRIAVATLSRPPVNALDGMFIESLDAMLGQVTADPEIAVLHLRSDERAFCAGADLALMQSCLATPEGLERMVDVVMRMQHLFARIESVGVVTVAEIGGAAMGGGLELALACDLRVAALDAQLGLPEARLGLLPAAGGTQRLTRLCGHGIAKRLILGAEVIDGADAARLGVVQWAQPRAQLAGWTAELVARIAGMPKAALAACKRCIHAAAESGRDGYAEEIAATRSLYDEPETRARVSEFLTENAARKQPKEMP